MAYRRLVAAGVLALGLVLAFLWLSAPAAQGAGTAVLCGTDYPLIQEAIDKADDGDVIRIVGGYYTETLVISESITLEGGWNKGCTTRATTDPRKTVIDGEQQGSVVWITGGSPRIESLTITGGWSNRGGGVRIEGGFPTLTYVIVTGNTVSTTINEYTGGAGVHVGGAALILNHTDIISNVAHPHPENVSFGAGLDIIVGSGKVVLIATRIMSNTAGGDSGSGGGVAVSSEKSLVFEGMENVIAFNRARSGGGIYTSSCITGATVYSNTGTYGGGVFLDGTYGAILANSIVAGNSSSERGSGIHAGRGGQIVNNAVVDNVGGVGVGVDFDHSSSGAVTLTNNIIVGHRVGIRNLNTTVSHTLVTNDLWDNEANYEGGLIGTTDVHVDPGFVDAAGGDYHLADDSLIIDAGTTLEWLDRDFEGDPRPIGVRHDIGADEWGRFIYMPLVLRAEP